MDLVKRENANIKAVGPNSTLRSAFLVYKGIGSKIQRKISSFEFRIYLTKLIEMTDLTFLDQFLYLIRFF